LFNNNQCYLVCVPKKQDIYIYTKNIETKDKRFFKKAPHRETEIFRMHDWHHPLIYNNFFRNKIVRKSEFKNLFVILTTRQEMSRKANFECCLRCRIFLSAVKIWFLVIMANNFWAKPQPFASYRKMPHYDMDQIR